MTISSGDLFLSFQTADGENVAIPVSQQTGVEGDLFFETRTAEGEKLPCAVSGVPEDGDNFLVLASAEGEVVAVPTKSGGLRTLPNSRGVVRDTGDFSFNNTTAVATLTASDYTPDSPDNQIARFCYWNAVDENDIALPVLPSEATTHLGVFQEFKEASYTFDTIELDPNLTLIIEYGFITASFNTLTFTYDDISTLAMATVVVGNNDTNDGAVSGSSVKHTDVSAKIVGTVFGIDSIFGMYVSVDVESGESTMDQFSASFVKDMGNRIFPSYYKE